MDEYEEYVKYVENTTLYGSQKHEDEDSDTLGDSPIHAESDH